MGPPVTLRPGALPTGLVMHPSIMLPLRVVWRELLDQLAHMTATPSERTRHALDAFLLAAAAGQILEDAEQPDHLRAQRALRAAREGRLPEMRIVSGLAGVVAASEPRLPRPRLTSAVRCALGLADDLAGWVAFGAGPAPEVMIASAETVSPARLGSLRDEVVRVPTCFRTFDQRPEDIAELATRLGELEPPVRVVGIRTSGSYLAPLMAAYLAASSSSPVRWMTVRPGARLSAAKRHALAGAGSLIVVDDPPDKGVVLTQVVDDLSRATGTKAVCAVSLLCSSPDLPPGSATLPWEDWHVARLLGRRRVDSVVTAAIEGASILTDRGIVAVDHGGVREVVLRSPASAKRGHAAVVLDVSVDHPSGGLAVAAVRAQAVGLGYLGRDSLVAAERVPSFIAPVYGLADGILVQAELDEEDRLRSLNHKQADVVADYVAERSRVMAIDADPSPVLAGRWPVWEWMSRTLVEPYGRWWPAARPLTARLSLSIVRSDRPVALDGRTGFDQWFAARDGSVRKVNFADTPSRTELACFDPVYDLADVAATEGRDSEQLAGALRSRYEERTGEVVDGERWLLYRLLHYLERRAQAAASGRKVQVAPAQTIMKVDDAMARAIQGYYAERFFSGLEPGEGPLCAIDVDNVLETRWLGVPATSPVGALALRALTVHGYRPVLVTGRSLIEVTERCAAYRLAGAVAEYGSVVYVPSSAPDPLVDAEGLATLEEAAASLGPEVHRDPTHEWSLRVHSLESGSLLGVPAQSVSHLRGLDVLPGKYQTDFVVHGIDKGRGLDRLTELLGGPVALAVGDDTPDLPMLARAEHAAAPSDASPALEHAARLSRRPGPFGLLDAVEDLLGHDPSRCRSCRPARTDRRAAAVQAALFALGGGRAEKLAGLALLARAVARAGRARPGRVR